MSSHSVWLRRLLWIALGVLTMCLALESLSRIRMDDDNLYLAYAAQPDRALASGIENSVIERIAASPHCEQAAYRLTLRQRYVTNYAGYLAVQGALQRLMAPLVASPATQLLAASLAAKGLFLVLFAVSLLLVAARAADRRLTLAFVLAFLLLAAAEIAMQRILLGARLDRTGKLLVEILLGRANSPFGVTPRNAALLLFAIALLLQWRGAWTWASAAILLISPLHQTYAGLGLALFSLALLVSRPEAFARTGVRLLLTGAGLVYLLREQFFASSGWLVRIAAAAALIGVAALCFRVVGSRTFAEFRRARLGRLAERELLLSIGSLLAVAALVALVSLVGSRLTHDANARTYFFTELTTRVLGFVRFPAAMALGLLVAHRYASDVATFRLTAGSAVACLALGAAACLNVDRESWTRLSGELEQQLGRPSERRVFKPPREEARIYAHLALVASGALPSSEALERIFRKRTIRCTPPSR